MAAQNTTGSGLMPENGSAYLTMGSFIMPTDEGNAISQANVAEFIRNPVNE